MDSRAADEIREIDGVIRSAAHRDSFEPLQRSALRDSDITAVLNRYQPHILHISGHAKPTEGLVLEDDNRKVAKIGCPELVSLILSSTDDDRLRLVFFSFCYSEACTKAISTKVPYAIGVKDEISAESLLLFTHVFYEALASGRSVRGAFTNARAWLKTKAPEEFDSMVLHVQPGTSAEVPFLSSMGFLKKSADEAFKTDSVLAELSARFGSQLRIAGYVTDDHDVRRAIYLDEGLYVHRVRAEAAVSEFITKATADTSRGGKWLSIVGDAGHGKSSLLWYLFSALSAIPAFTVIPIMAQMESDLAAVVRTAAGAREVRRQGRLVVLIDTLDLVVGVDDQQLAKTISEIMALGALVVTASRKQEADQLGRLLSSNIRVELRRYNDQEAQQAIRNQVRIYYPDKSEIELDEQFDKVWGLLEQQRDVRELDFEPLILRMLFEAYARQEIPRDVNTQQVYRHYWRQVVLSDRVVKNADERRKRDQLCRYVARGVAFGDTHSDKFLIGSLMKNPDSGLQSPFQTIEGLVSSGVLQWAEGRSSVRFFHQTFLEFTAAYDLLCLDPDSLQEYVKRLLDDVAGFNFFRAPILKQLTIQSFDNQELHLQLMRELRRLNNELAAQLALEIIGKTPHSERSHQIVRQWIEEEPEILRGVICETVRHYPKSKTKLALDLLQPYISSNKETSIYSICTETFSRSEPEIVHRFLHSQLARVIESNDDTKTYFKNALCAVARYGAANAINDLLELLPTVKAGQQSAILDGIAEGLGAETAPSVDRVVRKVIDLLPKIPGKHRNEVWDSLCRLTGALNRVSPTTAQPIANWLVQSKIWRRDIGTALFIGRIVGQIITDAPMAERAIDELRSTDHFARMFNTGLLSSAPPELSQHIMRLILELDQKSFSGTDSIRALFQVVSSLSDISASQMLEFLSRWRWPTSGIGNPLVPILKRLAATDPQATKAWLLKQLKQPEELNVRIIRALTLLIQERPDIFDSSELNEVYEASFAVQSGPEVVAAAVGAIATVDRKLAQRMFTQLFEEGKDRQITLINSLMYSLPSDPDFAFQFGPRIIEVSLQQHIPGLLDNYLVTLKSVPRRHSVLLLSQLNSWFTEDITQRQDAKILGELLALLKITAEADPALSFRISQRIPIVSKGIAGGLAALYDNVSEHSDDQELLGSVLRAVAKVSAYDQVRIGNALSRTLPRLGQKLGSAPVIEMVMSVYKTIESEQSLRAILKAALEIPGWGPKENAALLADTELSSAVRSVLSTRTRR
ncbi:MAG TPA: hypothetical protein DC047_09930 [Blastocatellia bacterium]|nr:hypothetical protein [Blastocatellia bacterium]